MRPFTTNVALPELLLETASKSAIDWSKPEIEGIGHNPYARFYRDFERLPLDQEATFLGTRITGMRTFMVVQGSKALRYTFNTRAVEPLFKRHIGDVVNLRIFGYQIPSEYLPLFSAPLPPNVDTNITCNKIVINSYISPNETGFCPTCQGPVERRGKRGPLPTYCSNACKHKAYRIRQKGITLARRKPIVVLEVLEKGDSSGPWDWRYMTVGRRNNTTFKTALRFAYDGVPFDRAMQRITALLKSLPSEQEHSFTDHEAFAVVSNAYRIATGERPFDIEKPWQEVARERLSQFVFDSYVKGIPTLTKEDKRRIFLEAKLDWLSNMFHQHEVFSDV